MKQLKRILCLSILFLGLLLCVGAKNVNAATKTYTIPYHNYKKSVNGTYKQKLTLQHQSDSPTSIL